MKFYYIKLDGGYLSENSYTTIKDKYKALYSSYDTAYHKAELLDSESNATIEVIELKTKQCTVGDVSFGLGGGYSLTQKEGIIIHETAKYVYTMKFNKWTNEYHNVEKHKKSNEDTQCFKTGSGFKRS